MRLHFKLLRLLCSASETQQPEAHKARITSPQPDLAQAGPSPKKAAQPPAVLLFFQEFGSLVPFWPTVHEVVMAHLHWPAAARSRVSVSQPAATPRSPSRLWLAALRPSGQQAVIAVRRQLT
jgi:hypothetical protein